MFFFALGLHPRTIEAVVKIWQSNMFFSAHPGYRRRDIAQFLQEVGRV
jgi:hypothetical protein